jgi:hypothetical protein
MVISSSLSSLLHQLVTAGLVKREGKKRKKSGNSDGVAETETQIEIQTLGSTTLWRESHKHVFFWIFCHAFSSLPAMPARR